MSRKILHSTLESASYFILFKIFCRCITFVLNAFVLRYITSDVVGVMNVRLLLLESTILFLSCEAFRRAALSQRDSHSWQQTLNLVWLTVPLSIIISFAFSLIWLYVLDVPSDDITPHYTIGVWSVSGSCVIEMLAEPLYIISQAYMFSKLRVGLPSLRIIIRTIIFVIWIVTDPSQALIAFSISQIVGNVVYTTGFYLYFHIYMKNNKNKNEVIMNLLNIAQKTKLEDNADEEDENITGAGDHPKLTRRQSSLVGFDEPFPFTSLSQFFPKILDSESWIHENSALLTWSFFKQGVLKQILTEGERYIMTIFSVLTFKEQGLYDVVNNLGSLAARFLFHPVEDSLYFYFTQSIKRDVKIKEQNQDHMKEASTVLSQALNCMTNIGLVIFIFGQSYSTLFLYLYGGPTIASEPGPTLLRTHGFSILLLAVNGITECYAFSTMTADQLNKYNYLMAIFSVSFLIISYGLTWLFGAVGFIYANCFIMSARIAHSLHYINSRYSNSSFQPLLFLIPKKYFLASLIISLFVTKLTQSYCNNYVHFLTGAACFFMVVIVWGLQERELVFLAIDKLKRKNKTE